MSRGLAAAWLAVGAAALGVRLWNALAGPLMWGYDAWGHVAYVLFLDLYGGIPWPDQGWSYFHPPLYYALGWVFTSLGSGELLVRSLSLLGSAASLATAGLAAWTTRAIAPARPGLALLAFGAVAFLPVQIYVSPMPGNEMFAAFLASAAVAVFVANARRETPSLWVDAGIGGLLGLGLLVKFSGLIPLAALAAALVLQPLLARRGPGRNLVRVALVTGVALLLATPYYARNVAVYGTPFVKSTQHPEVASVERRQPPGVRTLAHYVYVPPRMLVDPDPLAPHLLQSVWGSLYVSLWADVHRESDLEPTPRQRRRERRLNSILVQAGLLPTALFLMGALFAARDLWRGRRVFAYLPLVSLGAANLAAFAIYTWLQPTWPAARASYLLSLSLPFAIFVARGAEALEERARAWTPAGVVLLVAIAALAALANTSGLVLPRRSDSPATGAVHFYFGEYEAARSVYERLARGAPYPVPWLDNLAAVELADGRFARARELSARASRLARGAGRPDPYRLGRLAVATALAGDVSEARTLLDTALEVEPLPELLANRGALRAMLGELAGAEEDLEDALRRAPEMVPAWVTLSQVRELLGRSADSESAWKRAVSRACATPRGYPYGLGTGEIVEWGVGRRALLFRDGRALKVADPRFYRNACRLLKETDADRVAQGM